MPSPGSFAVVDGADTDPAGLIRLYGVIEAFRQST